MFDRLNVWKRIRKAEEKLEDLERQVTQYNTIITELCKAQQEDDRLIMALVDLFEQMAEIVSQKLEADRKLAESGKVFDLTLPNGLTVVRKE